MFGGNFAIQGWAFCDGQLMFISQNTALFSLLGTTYGGNGVSTFALPDLRNRIPLQAGQGSGLSNYDLGQSGGSATTALASSQIPAHSHTIVGDSALGTTGSPIPGVRLAAGETTYGPPVNLVPMAPDVLGSTGGLPHNNRQPYLGLNFIIAVQGIFPPRS